MKTQSETDKWQGKKNNPIHDFNTNACQMMSMLKVCYLMSNRLSHKMLLKRSMESLSNWIQNPLTWSDQQSAVSVYHMWLEMSKENYIKLKKNVVFDVEILYDWGKNLNDGNVNTNLELE